MEHYFARLQNAVRLYWEKPAVCNYRGESFTYGQLATQIERFHIFFEACGLKKGDRIAICAKNTARMAVSFFSVNTYETVVVPILSDFTPESVNHLVDHSESLILMTDNDIWAKLDIRAMPRLKAVVSVNDFTLLYVSDEKVREAFASVSEKFAQKYPMGFTGENVTYNTDNWDDLDIINYTSGTTSSPKGVMLTYKALSATIDFGQRHIPSSDKFTMVSMLPMAHMYGLVYEFLYPLCNGTSITFLGKTPSPTLLLSAMRDVKPYLLITVPLVMEKVFKSAIKPVVEKPVMKVLTRIPGIKSLLFKKIREKPLRFLLTSRVTVMSQVPAASLWIVRLSALTLMIPSTLWVKFRLRVTISVLATIRLLRLLQRHLLRTDTSRPVTSVSLTRKETYSSRAAARA